MGYTLGIHIALRGQGIGVSCCCCCSRGALELCLSCQLHLLRLAHQAQDSLSLLTDSVQCQLDKLDIVLELEHGHARRARVELASLDLCLDCVQKRREAGVVLRQLGLVVVDPVQRVVHQVLAVVSVAVAVHAMVGKSVSRRHPEDGYGDGGGAAGGEFERSCGESAARL